MLLCSDFFDVFSLPSPKRVRDACTALLERHGVLPRYLEHTAFGEDKDFKIALRGCRKNFLAAAPREEN